MATVNMLMTKIMNSPMVFVAGLAVGYIGAKIKQKFGRGGGIGGGGFA